MPGYIILMMGTDVITIYIFLQFFENLSPTLDESAILDGCTYFGVFFKILLPLLKPAIVTSAILKGVSTYNEYYMANLYLQDKTKYQVVATSLYVFSGPMATSTTTFAPVSSSPSSPPLSCSCCVRIRSTAACCRCCEG